jgi:hypothetical protein
MKRKRKANGCFLQIMRRIGKRHGLLSHSSFLSLTSTINVNYKFSLKSIRIKASLYTRRSR